MSTTVVNLAEPPPLPSEELVPVNSSQITLVSSTVVTMSVLSVWQIVMIIWILGIIIFLTVHLVKHDHFMNMVNPPPLSTILFKQTQNN